LTEGSSGSPDGKGGIILLRIVALVDKTGDDVTVLDREIIIGSINIGGNDGGEVASVFFGVGTVHGIDEALGKGITFVGGVRGSVMEHCFVDWIGGLVRENAGGEEGNKLLYVGDTAKFHDVIVDKDIFSVEFDLLCHISKQTPNLGSKVNNMGRLVLVEYTLSGFAITEVAILAGEEEPLFVPWGLTRRKP